MAFSFRADFERSEAAEYGDSSATYWDLYASEAEISDQKLVETLTSDTKAMSIMVVARSVLHTLRQPNPLPQNSIFSSIIAGFIYKLPRLFSQTTAKKPSVYCHSSFPRKTPPNYHLHFVRVLTLGSRRSAYSIKYPTRYQLLPGYDECLSMRS